MTFIILFIIILIIVHINVDQDGAWEEKEGLGETKLDDVASNNIAVAERLLRELKPIARNTERFMTLENYYLLATKQKVFYFRCFTNFRAFVCWYMCVHTCLTCLIWTVVNM